MTVYEKDTSFSIGWVFGGAVIMFLLNFFASIVITLTGWVHLLPVAIAVPCACFLAGGFIVGKWSSGRTIIEAGLGGAIAAGASIVLVMLRVHAEMTPAVVALGSVPPFFCALLGGYVGEKVQGDTIEVQD